MTKLRHLLLQLLLILISGCSKEELSEKLTFEDDFYPATSETGKLNGVYSALQKSGSATHGGYFSVQSVSSDEMAIPQKGGDWYEGGIWLEIHRHTWTPANGPITFTWAQQYSSIAAVNNAIANAGLDANQMAQAKVVRAYLHWRLMDLYGNIVIADGSGSNVQRTRTEVFNWIEDELLTVLGMVEGYNLSTLSNSPLGLEDNKYRINVYAALGILSKLYLNAEVYTGVSQWAKAASAAQYVIENGPYKLSDSSVIVNNLGKRPSINTDPDYLMGYAAIFAPNNENNPEIIFSIDYDEAAGASDGMNFAQMTLHYTSQYTWNFEAQPWNGYVALEEFVNSYDNNDARKKSNFIAGPQTDFYGNALVDLASDQENPFVDYTDWINELEPNAIRTAGNRLGKFSFQQFANSNMNNDYPIVRLSDIFLIYAEAVARNSGDWSFAKPVVDAIRARAGLGSIGTVTADNFLAERGREMFQEASRRTDLIRFGKWSQSWWEKGVSADYREIFPIPAEQLMANPNLVQNPGY